MHRTQHVVARPASPGVPGRELLRERAAALPSLRGAEPPGHTGLGRPGPCSGCGYSDSDPALWLLAAYLGKRRVTRVPARLHRTARASARSKCGNKYHMGYIFWSRQRQNLSSAIPFSERDIPLLQSHLCSGAVSVFVPPYWLLCYFYRVIFSPPIELISICPERH